MPSQNTLLAFGLFGLAVIIMLAIGGIVGHTGPMGIGLMPYNYYPEPLSKRNSKTRIGGRNPKSLVAPGPYAPLSTKFNERLMASMPGPSVDLEAAPASPPWRISVMPLDRTASH